MLNFKLHRNTFGRLVLTDAAGNIHEGVVPHAYPISAPLEGVALVATDGRELAWIEQLSELPDATRQLIEEELASREFIPEISKLIQVSTFATPSIWDVETDRGRTRFILKAEDDIRRINQSTLLIADSNGIHFLIRDFQKLGCESRKLLDRFL